MLFLRSVQECYQYSLGRCIRIVNPLQWRHNERDSVSNYQPHDCLFNRLFRRRSKKTSKLRVTGLSEGNSPGTGEFPAQMASNAANVSIWWRHHTDVNLNPSSRWLPRPLFFDIITIEVLKLLSKGNILDIPWKFKFWYTFITTGLFLRRLQEMTPYYVHTYPTGIPTPTRGKARHKTSLDMWHVLINTTLYETSIGNMGKLTLWIHNELHYNRTSL